MSGYSYIRTPRLKKKKIIYITISSLTCFVYPKLKIKLKKKKKRTEHLDLRILISVTVYTKKENRVVYLILVVCI